jgi:hypothetical protein
VAEFRVEITRTVALVVTAAGTDEAMEVAFDAAWEWQPENADGGDQGCVSVEAVKPNG